jgi:nitrate reductase gamma subunit
MNAWLEWARGPAFLFAFTFMVVGLLRHLLLTLWQITRTWACAGDSCLPLKQIALATGKWLLPVGKIRDQPLFTLTSILFHIAILIVPWFLAGHLLLWSRATGWSWPALPGPFADALTLLAIAAAAGLVLQRLASRTQRDLSRWRDYALPLLVALPFVTGFLFMHPGLIPLPFETLYFLHVMSANLLMIAIPLTRLTHAIMVPSLQLLSDLVWHWPLEAGSSVARALGKEGEVI